jgi:hypothetical protein
LQLPDHPYHCTAEARPGTKGLAITWPAQAAGKPNLKSPNLVNEDSWRQTEQSSLARLEKDDIAVAHDIQRRADVGRSKILHDPEQIFGSQGSVLALLETRQNLEFRNHGCAW